MERTALPRIAAALFLMLAIIVALIELGRDGEEAGPARPSETVAEPPLQGELQRCQALGEAAVRDAACLDIWAENRRRFLSTGTAQDEGE